MSDTETPEKAPDHIPNDERLKLWVRSGGRCAICNKFLLEDEFTGHYLNLAEAAHVVARSKKGPRGEADLAIEERNKVENLMLLCLDHHKLIDTEKKAGHFPRESLLKMKDVHERRIHSLTAMVKSQETTVMRVVGAIRDAAVSLTREEARAAVLDCAGKYPRYDLSVEGDLEIDLRGLPDEGDPSYWTAGKKVIDRSVDRFRDAIERKHVQHVSVFAIGRIPLLVYLGYALSDKVPADLYQKHRSTGGGWIWPRSGSGQRFESVLVREGVAGKGVALVLSISGTIDVASLPLDAADMPLYVIRPLDCTPDPDIFSSKEVLDAFALTYRNFLGKLEQTHKSEEVIHLFASAPLSAAVEVGRGLMRDAHPAMVVYDRYESGYLPTVTINARQ
ncbi:MAG: SAVED domain-containing protein [Fimbriimonas sp.]